MALRILMSGSRIVMSRPGVDALAPPAYTPEYLAMDSNWGEPERPVDIGLVLNKPLGTGFTTPFSQTFPDVPIVSIMTYTGNQIYDSQLVYESNKWVTPYRIKATASGFELSATASIGWNSTNRNWMYFAWRTW